MQKGEGEEGRRESTQIPRDKISLMLLVRLSFSEVCVCRWKHSGKIKAHVIALACLSWPCDVLGVCTLVVFHRL